MAILSKGWYPEYPHPDSDSFEWRVLVAYLVKHTKLPPPTIVSETFLGTTFPGPDDLVFSNGNTIVNLDAVTLPMHPELALMRLQSAFGMEVKNVPFVMPSLSPPPPPPPVNPLNPIGSPLANVDAPGYFHSLTSDHRPEGSIWPDPAKPEEVAASQGHQYYKQAELMYGLVWYQLL